MTMSEDLATSAAFKAQPGATASGTPAGPPGYELLDEVGRGGMGVVYRARDLALGRDVAVKILADRYPLDSPAAQRFLGEARITGQLQHPGIPAVHQVGSLPDGRPFLAMKLIKGCTLEAVLKSRVDPSAERGRLLAVFEAVCQAVGYAHAHGVIHRDLKPANVMVGAFGEVQVMDWGLAKVLGEAGTPAAADDSAPDLTRAWTEVSPTPEGVAHTQAGSLVGTPAFISPEQAVGELAKVDERADVFGLGALLAVILTGKPPYAGASFESVRVLAVRGKVEDCLARLAGCGAEPELVSLCRQCLAFEPADRPANAAEVAQAVARLRSAADERARTAEREKAAADARSEEQRRKRRWQLAAAGAVVVALVGGLAGLGVYLRAQARANADLEAMNSDLTAAKGELETTLYFQRIALAHRELSADNLGRTLELLDLCPEHLRQWEWRYLRRHCRVEPTVLRDPAKAEVTSIAFGPDGLHLASADGDGTLKLWNTRTGALIRTLPTGADFVYSVAFHPDGKHLASADAGGKLKVWDLTTGREVFAEEGYLGMHYPYGTGYGVAFSPDGRRLAAGKDGAVNVWDWNEHRLLHRLPGHEKRSISVTFSLDGQRLASGGWGGSLMIWDVESGKLLHNLSEHQDPISSLAFSPDGLRLASACFDRRLTVWDTTTGRQVESWRGQEGLVLGAAYSPDGLRLASCGEDRTVRLWEATTGREVLKLRGHDAMSLCVAFSPDGQRLASCSSDGTIRLWDAASLRGDETQEVLKLDQPSGEVWSLAVSPDGRRAATSGQTRAGLRNAPVYIWDLTTGRISLEFAGHPSVVFSVGWHPDGERIASSGWDDERKAHAVKVWDTRTGRTSYVLPRGGENFAVAFSPGGRHLVTGGADRVVSVWEAASGREVGTLGAHDRQIRGLVFSRDGRRLASASSEGTVKIWDAAHLTEHQEPLAVLRTRTAWEILNIAFSPEGDRLVTGGTENTVKVWDLTTGREVRSLSGHSGEVCATSFSPDPEGRWIASAGEDSTVKVWDSRTGTLLRNFRGHTGLVTWVAFTPDGSRLLSASRDGTVRVWDLSHLERKAWLPSGGGLRLEMELAA
jgi:WD40 repeat protein/serine/threonine protein kinase